MTTSLELLIKMRSQTETFIIMLDQSDSMTADTRHKISEYGELFNDLDDIITSYLDLFDTDSINELKSLFTSLLKSINTKIYKMCSHEFIEDSVDIDPDRSEEIVYCTKCYLCKET